MQREEPHPAVAVGISRGWRSRQITIRRRTGLSSASEVSDRIATSGTREELLTSMATSRSFSTKSTSWPVLVRQ